jgi:hypothetical protein
MEMYEKSIQIDHCMIDGRHFSDVINVRAQRGANIDSDHTLVVMTLRPKICREHTRQDKINNGNASQSKD